MKPAETVPRQRWQAAPATPPLRQVQLLRLLQRAPAPPGRQPPKVSAFAPHLWSPRRPRPPVELLRQLLDHGGFYDRQKLFWKLVTGLVAVAACGPPSGGRNALTPRFVRHHTVCVVPQPSAEAMKRIFASIVQGHLAGNGQGEITGSAKPLVDSTVDLYFCVLRDLKPIPAKSHYTFNLRDVSKVIQGVLMMKPSAIPSKEVLVKLWCHEACRVFCDRLIDQTDRAYFTNMLVDYVKLQFKMPWTREDLFEGENRLIFGDFSRMGVPREDRRYEEIVGSKRLPKLFSDYLGTPHPLPSTPPSPLTPEPLLPPSILTVYVW